jgi:hypothetical protein
MGHCIAFTDGVVAASSSWTPLFDTNGVVSSTCNDTVVSYGCVSSATTFDGADLFGAGRTQVTQSSSSSSLLLIDFFKSLDIGGRRKVCWGFLHFFQASNQNKSPFAWVLQLMTTNANV